MARTHPGVLHAQAAALQGSMERFTHYLTRSLLPLALLLISLPLPNTSNASHPESQLALAGNIPAASVELGGRNKSLRTAP